MLLPWLQIKLHNSWVDPRAFKSDAEYAYACRTAWSWAQAVEEILGFNDKLIEESEALTKKENGEVKDVLRDALS